jgi:hypothetical protein
MRDNRPEDIVLPQAILPYWIGPVKKASSYLTVRFANDIDEPERTIFYIPNGSIETMDSNYVRGTTSAYIQLRHPWASDEEGDGAYIGRLELSSLQFMHSWGNQMSFAGWLTEARFYPEGYVHEGYEEFNPFVKARRKKEDPDDDYGNRYTNAGYPYQPPRVHFEKGLKFPLQVVVTTHFDGKKEVDGLMEEYRTIHANARAEREAKAEAYRVEQAEKKARRDAEHALWLLTDEGKKYTIEREAMLAARAAKKAAQ